LIGYAQEPNVYINQSGLNFKSVLVGRQVKEILNLVNDESLPFSFQFNDSSVEMDSEGLPVLRINPMSGTIYSGVEMPIEITFLPTAEKQYNFNLSCNIRKKPTVLTVNVKEKDMLFMIFCKWKCKTALPGYWSRREKHPLILV
jgi:hypothetical protein